MPPAGTPEATPALSEPAATLPVPTDVSPTADSWEAEADDALLTPEDSNEPEDEEIEQQVCIKFQSPIPFLFSVMNSTQALLKSIMTKILVSTMVFD